MRKYVEIVRISIKTQLIWRTDTIIDILLSVIKVLFAWILWSTLFEGKEKIAELEFSAMMAYYVISSYLNQLDKSGEISQKIYAAIRNGTFSKYMIIPIRMNGYFFAMQFGKVLLSAIVGAVTLVICMGFRGIRSEITNSVFLLVCALILIIMGLVFMCELNCLLGILTMKFEEISTFLMIKDNIVAFVTGAIIPLALIPKNVITIMKLMPFYYITYLPSMLFIGRCKCEAIKGILVLGIWCLFIILFNKIVYEKYRIKYDGVGI